MLDRIFVPLACSLAVAAVGLAGWTIVELSSETSWAAESNGYAWLVVLVCGGVALSAIYFALAHDSLSPNRKALALLGHAVALGLVFVFLGLASAYECWDSCEKDDSNLGPNLTEPVDGNKQN